MQCMKKIAEYICHIPNKPAVGSIEVKAILKDMHINGEPASVAEDKQLWYRHKPTDANHLEPLPATSC